MDGFDDDDNDFGDAVVYDAQDGYDAGGEDGQAYVDPTLKLCSQASAFSAPAGRPRIPQLDDLGGPPAQVNPSMSWAGMQSFEDLLRDGDIGTSSADGSLPRGIVARDYLYVCQR